eukprot:tig00020927_g15992.t1
MASFIGLAAPWRAASVRGTTCTCECTCVAEREQPAAPAQPVEPKATRRAFFASAAAVVFSASAANHVCAEENGGTCEQCSGRGLVPCPLCKGTGEWEATNPEGFGTVNGVGFAVPKLVACPNCEKLGLVICTRCIGTGLASTKGLLRRKDLGISVRRDGSLAFENCDAIPACRTAGARGNTIFDRQEFRDEPAVQAQIDARLLSQ